MLKEVNVLTGGFSRLQGATRRHAKMLSAKEEDMLLESGVSIVDLIFERMESDGGAMYGGEPVTQLSHALQCAHLGEKAGAGAMLVTAALLHDYGHLINEDDAVAATQGRDLLHEDIAADYLSKWFPRDVTEPIRLHVPAKRYLRAVDETYFAALSPASVQSLAVQGGQFSDREATEFIARPFAQDAVQLRIWDDQAKNPERLVPGLAHYRALVEDCVLQH